jgi:hypothetical protein
MALSMPGWNRVLIVDGNPGGHGNHRQIEFMRTKSTGTCHQQDKWKNNDEFAQCTVLFEEDR